MSLVRFRLAKAKGEMHRVAPPSILRALRAGLLLAGVTVAALAITACHARPSTTGAEWTFDECYQAGLTAFRSQDDVTARLWFERARTINPEDAATEYYLSVLEAEKGNWEKAAQGFRRTITLDPSFPQAYYNLGTLLLERGDPMESASLLENAVSLKPDYTPAYVNLGKAYYLAGMPELASAAFEEALSRDPENRAALKNLAQLARAAGNGDAERDYRARLDALK